MQAVARDALQIAHKYSMPSVLRFYSMHAAIIASELQSPMECVSWLEAVCHAQVSLGEQAISRLAKRYEELLWENSLTDLGLEKLGSFHVLPGRASGLSMHFFTAGIVVSTIKDLLGRWQGSFRKHVCWDCKYEMVLASSLQEGMDTLPQYCPLCMSTTSNAPLTEEAEAMMEALGIEEEPEPHVFSDPV